MKNLINTCNFNKMNKNDKNRIVVNNLMNYLNRSCKIVVRHLNRLSTFIHKSAERWHSSRDNGETRSEGFDVYVNDNSGYVANVGGNYNNNVDNGGPFYANINNNPDNNNNYVGRLVSA